MFNLFDKNKEPQNLKEAIKKIKELEKKMGEIDEVLKNLKDKNKISVQKVGIVRFNPFSGLGSDQSFSVALLDGDNNGVVITSLFTREGNRVYGKSVEKGISKYTLSNEEREAIKKAIASESSGS